MPLLILIFEFSPKYAIPLSNFTILGASITNMYLNLPKRHPEADRPLVDWDLILMMEPLTMLGAIVGSYIGKILPDEVLVFMLVVLLGLTTHRTIGKGIKKWNEETVELAAGAQGESDAAGHGAKAMQAVLEKQDEEEEEMAHEALLDANRPPSPSPSRAAAALSVASLPGRSSAATPRWAASAGNKCAGIHLGCMGRANNLQRSPLTPSSCAGPGTPAPPSTW